jgi:hypothetical protein
VTMTLSGSLAGKKSSIRDLSSNLQVLQRPNMQLRPVVCCLCCRVCPVCWLCFCFVSGRGRGRERTMLKGNCVGRSCPVGARQCRCRCALRGTVKTEIISCKFKKRGRRKETEVVDFAAILDLWRNLLCRWSSMRIPISLT